MCSSLVVGDILLIGAMKSVYLLNAKTLEILNEIPTSEWAFSLCMIDESTLVCGQSFGYIDLIKIFPARLETILKTKFEKASHIYAIQKTSRIGEFAIAGYNGLYFGHITQNNIGILPEAFLQGKVVR